MSAPSHEEIRARLDELTFTAVDEERHPTVPDVDIETIVVGVDDKEGTEDALAWANALAGRTGAKVWLLHVAPPTGPAGSYAVQGWVDLDAYEERLEGEAAELLETKARELDAAVDVEVQLGHGRPATQIEDLAAQVDADLVVVGSHGHGTVGRALLGSTADALKERLDRDLLVARSQPPLESILVPVDGSEPSVHAAALALRLGPTWGAQIDLMHVVPLPVYALDGGTKPLEQAFFEAAEGWAYPNVETHIRFGEDVGDKILEAAVETGAGLVAMGRRGLGALEERIAGSVSRKLLHNADTSVLVSSPTAEAE